MSYDEVVQAYQRISPYIHRTPVMTSSFIDSEVGRSVYFKCENLQKTGSFKARGALNAVLKVKQNNPDTPGVVGHSSGNHAQGLAWAAGIAGVGCTVVSPDVTPAIKLEATRGYGADIVISPNDFNIRNDLCQKINAETGKAIVPPSDNYDVIAGQGTVAMEFLEEVPDLDAILVPCSCGGLTAGVALTAAHIRPSCKVFACAPPGKLLEESLRAGKPLWTPPVKVMETIAESIRHQSAGDCTFPLMLKYLQKDVFATTDEEMVNAMRLIWQRMKLIIEVSSATTVAAALSDRMKGMDSGIKKVGVVLSGGNVDLDHLPW